MDNFIQRMIEQQEKIQCSIEGPIKHFRKHEAAITRMQKLANNMGTGIHEIAVATATNSNLATRFHALIGSSAAALAKLTTPDFTMAMDHYVCRQQQMHKTIKHLILRNKTWTDHVATMSSFIDATRFTLPTIDFDRVGSLIAAVDLQRDAVVCLTDRLLFHHDGLIKSFNQPGSLLASVPLVVSDLPTMNVFVHTSAVRSITPHESLKDEDEERIIPLRRMIATETDMFLEQTLPKLKLAFLEQYQGVKARTAGRGPDGWTQGSASMRKLLKGVLHSVAPNKAVLPWAMKNNKKLDKHGRPTRATKIDWLCHFSENNTYRAYVQIELKSALALIELMDTAQHGDEFSEFSDRYDWIMLRAKVAVRHILTLWELSR